MISQRLRQLRREKNLTLDQLASLSKISRGTIHRIESDDVAPRVDTLEVLCRALGVELGDFFQPGVARGGAFEEEPCRSEEEDGLGGSTLAEEGDVSRHALGLQRGLLEWLEHLEALVHESLDMLSVLDRDGFIIYESPSTMRMLGRARAKRFAHPWCFWVHPEEQGRIRAAIGPILGCPRENVTLEYRLRSQNGSWRWVRSIFSNQLEHPAIRGILVNTHDITLLKELELDLKASEGRLRAIVEAIPDTYLLVHMDGGLEPLHQTQPGDIQVCQGSSGPSFLGEVDLDWLGGLVRKACETGELQWATYEQMVEGKRQIREVRIQKSGSEEALVLIRDMTSLKEHEERLLQVQKLESLGAVAGGISHHFNNLLMGIQSHLELAIQRLPRESPIHRNLAGIQHALGRAAYITAQLRDFAGHPAIFPEPVNVAELVRGAVSRWLDTHTSRCAVEVTTEPGLLWAHLDPLQIRRVLFNLLTNACEAMAAQPGLICVHAGSVRLELEEMEAVFPDHGLAGPGEYVILEVRDAGCGIEAALRSRIFDPFFTTKPTGRGLGLPATDGIVRAHQGGIRVESQIGEGSVFTIYLPQQAACGSRETARQMLEAGRTPASRTKILLAEDEEILRTCLGAFLVSKGYQPLEAANGEEAIELFRRHAGEIALVLLDLNMPLVDGMSVFRCIRRIDPEAKVVISTGSCEDTVSGSPEAQNLFGFLRKPYQLKDLADFLRRLG